MTGDMNPIAQTISKHGLSGTQALVLYALAFEGASSLRHLRSATGIADIRTLRKAINPLIEKELVEENYGKITGKKLENYAFQPPLNTHALTISKDMVFNPLTISKDMGVDGAIAPPPLPINVNDELVLSTGDESEGELVCYVHEVLRPDVMDELIACWNAVVSEVTEERGAAWITPDERKFRIGLAYWLLTKGNIAKPNKSWILKMSKVFKDNEWKKRRTA